MSLADRIIDIYKPTGVPADTLVLLRNSSKNLVLEVMAVYVYIDTDANAANRSISLQLLDKDGLVVERYGTYQIQADKIASVTFKPDVTNIFQTDLHNGPPFATSHKAPRYLFYGDSLELIIYNKQAGDANTVRVRAIKRKESQV